MLNNLGLKKKTSLFVLNRLYQTVQDIYYGCSPNIHVCYVYVCVYIYLFVYSGRKSRLRRAESPTPDITVKKDKYNKGIKPFPKKTLCWFIQGHIQGQMTINWSNLWHGHEFLNVHSKILNLKSATLTWQTTFFLLLLFP